ncbi:MAG: ATP-binding protein [bacterium]|nr:ATP-binding protein [bacterium]
MIPREAEKTLKKMAQDFSILLITGPRQSGKTTLVKKLFPDFDYVLLEDIDEREFALTDPRGFLDRFPKGVILDEVQRTPDLLSYLLGLSDQNKKRRFILTGSQNILLMDTITQSLAGRVGAFHLLPLSHSELVSASISLKSLEKNLFTGFYPKIHDENLDPQMWLQSYYRTYLERDVRTLSDIGDLNSFQRFVRLCAARSGQILNFSALANDAGISHPTAKKWLSVLEASFIVRLLEPHHKNFSKRLIKSPKLYFLDTGLLCYLLRITSSETLRTHALRGAIFETFVVSELVKTFLNRSLDVPLYYWRDHTGNEIDILVEYSDHLLPLEIKSGHTISSDAFKGLRFWMGLPKNPNKRGILVYAGPKRYLRERIEVMPWDTLKLPVD